MSYCVNCGVELDKTATICVLCNTPVVNPKQAPDLKAHPPFPKEKGQVEDVDRKDMGVFLTTVVLATSITCWLLNSYVFQGKLWSLAVIGVCIILWVAMVPIVIVPGLSLYSSLLLDGAAAAGYLYMLTFVVDRDAWFWGLGLPIVIYITVVAEILCVCVRKLPKSFLATALYYVTAIGILCGGLEFMIDGYATGAVQLKWSAIVLTVCFIIDIAIITMMSLRRLRDAVRRRLHF